MPEASSWAKLVIVRHGESDWNKLNVFTGWVDRDLSEQGVTEARRSGQALKDIGFVPDFAHTSMLKRAIRTLWLMLEEADLCWVPVKNSWRLNERHYGSLQGKNKAEMAKEVGAERVHELRRSYTTRPPLLDADDPTAPAFDKRYKGADVSPADLPLGESLEDCYRRVIPYWNAEIAPQLSAGKNVLIAAHGNSLRALIKHIEGISDGEIAQLNVPTGRPKIYELNEALVPVRAYFHGNSDEVEAQIKQAESQVVKR